MEKHRNKIKTRELIRKLLDEPFTNPIDLKPVLEEIFIVSAEGGRRSRKLADAGCLDKCLKLLTWAMKANSKDESEELDDFVQLCSSVISNLSGPTARVAVTKTYVFKSSRDGVLKSHELLIREPDFSEADVGWCTWPAGLSLAEYILDSNDQLKGKNVIDLGCGTALAGIACAVAGANKVVLTDFIPAIVSNAWHNLALNGFAEKTSETKDLLQADSSSCNAEIYNACGPCDVSAMLLDWNDIRQWHNAHVTGYTDFPDSNDISAEHKVRMENPLVCENGTDLQPLHHAFDVVIAGDCVYEEEHGELLPIALSFLAKNDTAAICLTASPEKKRPGIHRFESKMKELGFVMQVVSRQGTDTLWASDQQKYSCYIFHRSKMQIESL